MAYTVDPLNVSFSQVSGYTVPDANSVDFTPREGNFGPLGTSTAVAQSIPANAAISSSSLLAVSTATGSATIYATAATSSLLGESAASAYKFSSATLGGIATRPNGGSIDAVLVYDHTTHELAYSVTLGGTGRWRTEAVPGSYDILYVADGCQPVCHGPYQIPA